MQEKITVDELNFTLKHVGVNCKNAQDAEQTAGTFAQIFGLEKKNGNSSVFAGTALEAMKEPYLGKNGHIAMGTSDIEKAKKYLEQNGVAFNEDSAKYKDGKLLAIYLQDEIGGFAVHLVQSK